MQACSYQHTKAIKCLQLGSGLHRPARVLARRIALPSVARSRGTLIVRANELNKWGNIDGGDEDAGLPENGFDKDTAAVVLRVLTARATQTVLGQLSEFDIFVAQWLNNFVSENPPSEGNKFLLKLFAQPGKTVLDPNTDQVHSIEPQSLAHRILQVRTAMAQSVLTGFSSFVSLQNTSVLRAHLENNSYTCGGTDRSAKGSLYRRSAARPRKGLY